MNLQFRLTIALCLLLISACSSKPKLHVIGIYQGEMPAGVVDVPWWAKCEDLARQMGVPPDSAEAVERCHLKFAGETLEKQVVVEVTDTTGPLVLALTAYDATLWRVNAAEDVKISKVILGGFHQQRIIGVSPKTPIDVYTYDDSPCERCWLTPVIPYQGPPSELRGLTGLEIASFQGKYSGGQFLVHEGTRGSSVEP